MTGRTLTQGHRLPVTMDGKQQHPEHTQGMQVFHHVEQHPCRLNVMAHSGRTQHGTNLPIGITMTKEVKASNAKARSFKAKNGTVTTIGSGKTKVLGNES